MLGNFHIFGLTKIGIPMGILFFSSLLEGKFKCYLFQFGVLNHSMACLSLVFVWQNSTGFVDLNPLKNETPHIRGSR